MHSNYTQKGDEEIAESSHFIAVKIPCRPSQVRACVDVYTVYCTAVVQTKRACLKWCRLYFVLSSRFFFWRKICAVSDSQDVSMKNKPNNYFYYIISHSMSTEHTVHSVHKQYENGNIRRQSLKSDDDQHKGTRADIFVFYILFCFVESLLEDIRSNKTARKWMNRWKRSFCWICVAQFELIQIVWLFVCANKFEISHNTKNVNSFNQNLHLIWNLNKQTAKLFRTSKKLNSTPDESTRNYFLPPNS